MFFHLSFKITIYEQLSFVSISAGFFYLQHSYFVKNAMLINSAVSYGLGIGNEEFIYLFFATSLNRYLIYISQFDALLLIQFGKKIHFEMFF